MNFEEYLSNVVHGFKKNESNGTVFFSVPMIDDIGKYKHGFFSRIGGVSEGCFDSLNFSFKRETNHENIYENFKIACKAIGTNFDELAAVHYEHGNGVHVADIEDAGQGITRENTLPFCDGMIVVKKGITAVSMHADCTPIFFADKNGTAAGVCHAGWKGVYANITSEMINKMLNQGCERDSIVVGVGPCMNVCCFEVQSDVSGKFIPIYGDKCIKMINGNQHLDMPYIITKQLFDLGIPAENITLSDMCTYCEPELFYSYRRDNGMTGAMTAMMLFC